MASSDTVFVFVPGAFHTPVHYSPVIKALKDQGYASEAVNFPTIGKRGDIETKGIKDELAAIHAVVDKYIEQKKNVILCPHSFGGFSGSRAVKGREVAPGRPFGIKHVYFLTAFLIPENISVFDFMAPFGGLPDWIKEGDPVREIEPKAVPLLFSDLSAEDQKHWGSELRCQNRESAMIPWGGACWDVDVPKTLLITTADAATPLPAQEMAVSLVSGGRPENEWSQDRIDSGHACFISKPVELAKMLIAKD